MTCKWSKCKWHVKVLHGCPRRLIDPLRWNYSVPRALSVKLASPRYKRWKSSATGLLTNSPAYITFHLTTKNCIWQIQRKNQVMFVYQVLQSLRPTSSSPRACSCPTSPGPHVSASPRPRVPASLRPRVQRPTSHVPRPSPQVPVPLLVTAGWIIVLVMWVLIGSLKGSLKVSLVRFTRKRLTIYKPPVNLEDRRVNVSRSERLRILYS